MSAQTTIKHRPSSGKGDLARRLAEAAEFQSSHYQGGFGRRIRKHQALMREAAEALAKWGRPTTSRQTQPGDLLKGDAT